DEARLAADFHVYLDGRGDRGTKELHGLLDKAAQLQRHPFLLGLSAKDEHPLDEIPSPEPCVENPLEEVLLAASFERAVFRQFGKPYHGRQNVIEIMGDAAGERAE